MLCSNKIIALVITICSLDVHRNNGFKIPIYNEQQGDIIAPPETESIDQLEIPVDRLDDDDDENRMNEVTQERFQLRAINYKPFIDLATQLPQIIKMFHNNNNNNPMITDELSSIDINAFLDVTTVEEEGNVKQTEKYTSINTSKTTKTKPSFTTITTTTATTSTTSSSSSSSGIGVNARDNDSPPLPEKLYNSDVNNMEDDGEEEDAFGEAVKTSKWPITERSKLWNTQFTAGNPDNGRDFPIVKQEIPRYYLPPNDHNKFPTICVGRSTLYNELKVWSYNQGHQELGSNYRVYKTDMVLRRLIYEKGVSEKCHTPDMTDILDYLNCAILRNMRMESVHPSYPKIQLYD